MTLSAVSGVRRFRILRGSACAFAATFALGLPLVAQEKVDNATIERIKNEAMNKSQVMEIMSWMTDVVGPRLTWSPNERKAADWATGLMKQWGLANVHLERWDTPAGLGWQNDRFTFLATAPNPFIVEGAPRAWSAGTKGKVTGAATLISVGCTEELQANYAGKLKNAFVMFTPPYAQPVNEFNAWATRVTDSALTAMSSNTPPAGGGGGGGGGRGAGAGGTPPQLSPICQQAADRRAQQQANAPAGRGGFPAGGRGGFNVNGDTTTQRWLQTQGVAAIMIGGGGRGYVGGNIATDNGASRAKGAPQVPFVHVATESYGRIARLLQKNIPVTLELDMQNRFFPENNFSSNVIAEIPGTDPALKDEVVMIGAHFDSWHSATGATDNGAGSGVMMEAMRILKALNVQPRRTIRIALWTGEEQGLLGSRAYVRQHFGYADSTGFHAGPDHAKLAAYFNVDNGSGKIRGVYAEGMETQRPIFDAWMGPFKAMGMGTVTMRNTGGTDHLSYLGVGLPGFQFIQDGLDYGTRTHHTNQDVYERLQPDDMKFNSAVLAAFAWQAAQRDEKLPRPALPGATGGGRGRGGR